MRSLGHTIRHAALLVVQVGLLLALCGFLLAIAERHNRRYDTTPEQDFVIAEQSRVIAAGLREPVRIRVFYNGQESGQRRQVADLLDQFTAATALIEYELYDLDRTPGLARTHNVTAYNTGVMEGRGRTFQLQVVDELEVASGLLKLSRDQPRALCFLAGHGEHRTDTTGERGGYSDVARALEKEQYQIRSFDVAPGPEVLKDCTVVILAGPTQELFADEAERLAVFLQSGGRMLALIDPNAPASVVALLERFGLRADEGVVVDERNRMYGADSFLARVPIFDRDTFHKQLDVAAAFPVARPVAPIDSPPAGAMPALMAMTSPESWAQMGTGDPTEKTPRFRDGTDKHGPVPVGAIVSVDRDGAAQAEATGRLAVFGDSDFASNFYLNLLGNKDLFMSVIGVLAEDRELVAVRAKGTPRGTLSPIYLTARQGRLIFWLSVVVVPGMVILAGTLVAYWRRLRH